MCGGVLTNDMSMFRTPDAKTENTYDMKDLSRLKNQLRKRLLFGGRTSKPYWVAIFISASHLAEFDTRYFL